MEDCKVLEERVGCQELWGAPLEAIRPGKQSARGSHTDVLFGRPRATGGPGPGRARASGVARRGEGAGLSWAIPAWRAGAQGPSLGNCLLAAQRLWTRGSELMHLPLGATITTRKGC